MDREPGSFTSLEDAIAMMANRGPQKRIVVHLRMTLWRWRKKKAMKIIDSLARCGAGYGLMVSVFDNKPEVHDPGDWLYNLTNVELIATATGPNFAVQAFVHQVRRNTNGY